MDEFILSHPQQAFDILTHQKKPPEANARTAH
jgi:hypothetical protein